MGLLCILNDFEACRVCFLMSSTGFWLYFKAFLRQIPRGQKGNGERLTLFLVLLKVLTKVPFGEYFCIFSRLLKQIEVFFWLFMDLVDLKCRFDHFVSSVEVLGKKRKPHDLTHDVFMTVVMF